MKDKQTLHNRRDNARTNGVAAPVNVGILIKSSSLISDAIHSLSDIYITGIVMFEIKISDNPPDGSHPYVYEKVETVIALGLGAILFFTPIFLGKRTVFM